MNVFRNRSLTILTLTLDINKNYSDTNVESGY